MRVGDTVKVHYAFNEKDKRKSQIFEGIVLNIKGRETNRMITVRKMSRSGIGVERIIPLISPFLDNISLVKKAAQQKAKLYYIRNLHEKQVKAKIK